MRNKMLLWDQDEAARKSPAGVLDSVGWCPLPWPSPFGRSKANCLEAIWACNWTVSPPCVWMDQASLPSRRAEGLGKGRSGAAVSATGPEQHGRMWEKQTLLSQENRAVQEFVADLVTCLFWLRA